MPPRRQLISDSEPEEPSGSAGPPRRGIRQRALELVPHQAAEVMPHKGIKRRLMKSGELDEPTSKQTSFNEDAFPFNAGMRRDWGKGVLSSPQILDYASRAARQGMPGARKLARTTLNTTNSHRDMVRALGWLAGAPSLKWLEVEKREGGTKLHPVICPIQFLEKLLESGPEKFESRIKGDAGEIPNIWHGLRDSVVRTALGDKRIHRRIRSLPR